MRLKTIQYTVIDIPDNDDKDTLAQAYKYIDRYTASDWMRKQGINQRQLYASLDSITQDSQPASVYRHLTTKNGRKPLLKNVYLFCLATQMDIVRYKVHMHNIGADDIRMSPVLPRRYSLLELILATDTSPVDVSRYMGWADETVLRHISTDLVNINLTDYYKLCGYFDVSPYDIDTGFWLDDYPPVFRS